MDPDNEEMITDVQLLIDLKEQTHFPLVQIELDTRNLVLGDHDELLDCLFCQNIVFDAKFCSSCERLFCSACIEVWLQKNTHCPGSVCARTNFVPANPSLWARRALEKLNFRCEVCE
jgi:hypothetical protein